MRIEDKTWKDPLLLLTTVPAAILMLAFFLVPLGMTVALSFQQTVYYRLHWTWDLKIWKSIFSQSYYWSIMGHTVWMAALATILCILISYPVAYALVRRLPSMERQVTILIIFAFLTDAVLKTFGWVLFLDRSGVLNGLLQTLGLGPHAVDLLYTPAATIIGMVYNLVPYTITTLFLSMARIDRDLQLAAYDAGASRWRTFFEVTLPLSRPGLYAGSALVFILGLGVFLESKVLGGGTAPMAAELIRQTFETRVNWPLGAALTLVLIAIGALIIMLSIAAIAGRSRGRANA